MKQQQGFTLIELIVVIVILGILAATAVPKFVNLQGDARFATIQGVQGSIESAKELVHARWLAQGSTTAGSITMSGFTVTVTAQGYPDETTISQAITLPTGVTNTGGVIGYAAPLAACAVTYTVPGGIGTTSVVGVNAAACGG